MPLKAVLIDMDDTLLRLDTQAFTRRYMEPLAQFVIARSGVTADQYRTAFSASIRAVTAGRDPLMFNRETMDNPLRAGLNVTPEQYRAITDEFFATHYRGLREGSSPALGAEHLIEFLKARGLRVIVATNPLFNTPATEERLRWAAIDPAAVDFITTADNMHFVKPSLHYYLEILARFGLAPEDALMVGDDLSNDIAPAALVGLATFHVRWNTTVSNQKSDPLAHSGTLGEVARLIGDGWPPARLPNTAVLSPDTLKAALLADVAALHGLSHELSDLAWHMPLITDRRSPAALVAALIARERSFERPAMHRIVHEDNPFIQPTSEIVVSAAPSDADQAAQVQNFADERAQTLAFLAELTPDQWKRTAQHAIFGPTNLAEMVGFTIQHDRRSLGRLAPTAVLPLL